MANPSDKTLEILINDTWDSKTKNPDGMDIALCSITGNSLQYSGANNPLWIIHKGDLTELGATKQPIGLVDNPAPFITVEHILEAGDAIYIFSDGFSDQFGGGEPEKKFTSKRLKELLRSISDQPMKEQRTILEEKLMDWKGNKQQIDDVCIMGVRFMG